MSARTESKPKPEPGQKPAGDVPAVRKCMRCGGKFKSSGWGNRMCIPCKRPRDIAGADY